MGYYYLPNLEPDVLIFSSEESRHLIKVMRYKSGNYISISDGKGTVIKAQIIDEDRNACSVAVVERHREVGKRIKSLHVAVSPTKNADRMEWFVEKAVEIGIEMISFVICEHSERKQIDLARMNRIAISALKQSAAAYLPEFDILSFADFLEKFDKSKSDKFIAWCSTEANTPQFCKQSFLSDEILLLIGPEGDFSQKEIEKAKNAGFQYVKLGNKVLRTETAALYGVCVVATKLLS